MYYFMHMLDKYRVSKTDVNRVNMVRARSEYKNANMNLTGKKQTSLLLQKIRMPNNTGIC